MDTISIDIGEPEARPSRFPVRLAVAVGETAESATPWGIASDVSARGLFVRTNRPLPKGAALRLWFVDGRELLPVDARVARFSKEGIGVSFCDESFYRWAFARTTTY